MRSVFFISSIPGKFYEPIWGQTYLKTILKQHTCLPSGVPSDWPIIGQCSSLGSMGKNDRDWLTSEFVKNLSATSHIDQPTNSVPFNLVRLIFVELFSLKYSYFLFPIDLSNTS